LTGTFGKTGISIPRARILGETGKTREWKRKSLRAYRRRATAADALIAGAYLAGTNMRRVRRTLKAVFNGAIGKDVASRIWRSAKGDWDLWNRRPLGEEPIIRLILDGSVLRVRRDRRATSISFLAAHDLLAALGVCADGQKVLLAVKNMGGKSETAWQALLDGLVARGLMTPELVIVDSAPGLEKALAALCFDVAAQRCTVHKRRNPLAHAPERLHEETSNDYTDMVYASTKQEVEAKRKRFIRKLRLKYRAVADSLEDAGEKLCTFKRLPPSQWRSIRTSNAIVRLHEKFKRRNETQAVLPCAETAAMLFWAPMTSGQITMRKPDVWESLDKKPVDQTIDLAARSNTIMPTGDAPAKHNTHRAGTELAALARSSLR
jgi:putative transposase